MHERAHTQPPAITDARAYNLAAVRPLLEGCALAVRAAEGHEVLAAVDLDLVTGAGVLRVRLEPNVVDQPAFARTASLAISHLPDAGGAPLSGVAIAALRAFARHVGARDRGGVVLRVPPRVTRRLPMVGAGGESAEEDDGASGPWSRARFDRGIARAAAEGGAFLDAVLVVVQACEMSCRFCPSGDRARAVPDELTPEGHYEELLHQLGAARSLRVDILEIGGNDVLMFPRAVDLFRAAGELGFRKISAQSPGQRLADAEFARAVADSPLDRVDLPIYGTTAEAHEAVTRAPGSFDGLCRAVDRALALGRPAVELHTIALGSTLDGLDELLAFGRSRFGLEVNVQLLRPNRVGEREHLDDAAGFVEIAAAARRHARSFGRDIPLCALPEARARELHRERTAIPAFGRRLHLWDLGLRDGADDARAKIDRTAVFPAACDRCTLRGGCLGVLRAYVDRFGEGAIRPFG